MLMGQYKVPQNVETEDKILGPLSIKQFVYVIIALLWAFLMWSIFKAYIIVAVILALPVTGFFLLLGFGQREGVPFEDYVVAFIRFLLVPRKRVWIKDDSKEVIVKDTKKPEDLLRPQEKSVSAGQLKQLASIIDTRGNFKDPSIQVHDDDSDAAVYANRIIGPATNSGGGQTVAGQVATISDDVLDEANQHNAAVGALLQNVEHDVRQNAVAQVQQALQQPTTPQTPSQQPTQTTPAPPAANQAAAQLARQAGHLTVQQVAARAAVAPQQLQAGSSVQVRKPSV